MPHNTHYITTRNTQWNEAAQNTVHTLRQHQADQNDRSRILAQRIMAMGSITKRTNVLAQIFSPSGRVHVHHSVTRNITCFPQSVCWRFPEVSDIAADIAAE